MIVKSFFFLLTFLFVDTLAYSQGRSEGSPSAGDGLVGDISDDPYAIATIPPETGLEDMIVDQVFEPDRSSTDTLAVGTPTTSFGVSQMGGATYSIHIDCPKGINGVEPDLSIVYDSQAGNGPLGMGFGLSCMSSITFTHSDVFHDGCVKPLSYDWTDSLALDGRRLHIKSGTHGTVGAVYTPEGDPFTTVTIMEEGSTGNIFFRVTTPDGMRYDYGQDTSLLTFQIDSLRQFRAWYLYRSLNRYSRTIIYKYSHVDNTMYLNGLYYGNNSIKITYEARSNDTQTYYVEGVMCKSARRISKIKTKAGDYVYRTYSFSYNTSSDRSGVKYSRLTSITERDGAGKPLKPVKIDWNYLTPPSLSPTVINGLDINFHPIYHTVRDSLLLTADMNGDGLSDIVQIINSQNNADHTHQLRKHVYVSLSNAMTDGTVSYGQPIHFEMSQDFKHNQVASYVNGMSVSDFDGDGLEDLLFSRMNDSYGQYVTYTVISGRMAVTLMNGGGYPCVTENVANGADEPIYTVADFDADGKTEIFHLETTPSDSTYRAVYIHHAVSQNPDTLVFDTSRTLQLTIPSKPELLMSGDFNNDGLTDIMVLCSTGYKIFLNKGTAPSGNPFSDGCSFTGTDVSNQDRVIQGDFNGDGLPDMLTSHDHSSYYYILTSNGDCTFTRSSALPLGLPDQATINDDNRRLIFADDFDGDGRTDIIIGKAHYYNNGNNSDYTRFKWLRSNGNSFTSVLSYDSRYPDNASNSLTVMGRFTTSGRNELLNYGTDITIDPDQYRGDSGVEDVENDDDSLSQEHEPQGEESIDGKMGRQSQAEMGDEPQGEAQETATSSAPGQTITMRIYPNPGNMAAAGHVSRFTDGMGNATDVTYRCLPDGRVYHRHDETVIALETPPPYPLVSTPLPFSVVSSYTATNGAAGTASVSMRYGGLKRHIAGRGMLGFSSMSTTDNISGMQTSTKTSDLDPTWFVPLQTVTTTKVANDSTTTRHSLSTVASGNNYKAYTMLSESTDIYGDTTVTRYTYDTSKGVPTLVNTTYESEESMFKKTKYALYTLKGFSYHPRKVTISQKHSDDNDVHTNVTEYSYDNYGAITSLTEHKGTAMERTSTYTYDTRGNMLTKTVPTTSDSTMTTIYTYIDYRDLATVITTPATTSHSYTYNRWGDMLTHTETVADTTILTTTYTYDRWHNPLTKTSPEGIVTTYTRGWGSTPEKKCYLLEERQGVPWVKTWYDSMGREVMTESVGPDHVHKDRVVTFNSRGLPEVIKDILGSMVTCDTTFYDSMGRISEERHTGGMNTRYTYGIHSVTSVIDMGPSSSRELVKAYDPWGCLTFSSDNGTAINYIYSSNGNPRTVTSCGHTTSISYDVAGNRTSIIDPDAGESTWQYDRCGNVIRHTDERGVVTQSQYYATGLPKTVTIGDTTHYYIYGPDRLTLETVKTTTCESRTWHDKYGRVTYRGTWKSGDGTIYQKHTYDSYGRRIQTYSNKGASLSMVYDEYGYLLRIKHGNDVVMSTAKFNGRADVRHTLCDSLKVIGRTDNAGRLTSASVKIFPQTSGIPGSHLINGYTDSISCVYDGLSGNITSMAHYMGNGSTGGTATAAYTYDALDRLTGCTTTYGGDTPPTSMAMTYGNDGNILTKTGIGAYTYGTSKPHAVIQVGNAGGMIPQAGQDVAYNAYGKVSSIDEGQYGMEIWYAPNKTRIKSVLTRNDTIIRTVLYGDGIDIIAEGGRTYSITYIEGGVICVRDLDDDSHAFYQAFTDPQGSITRIIDGKGRVVFDADYDPWGRQTVGTNTISNRRGYTGHEMLPEFGLINMNGRMYDPLLGRFLSPDDFVQVPESPQGFNRYSYCMNNPMKYTDPSGEFISPVLLAAAFGFASGYLGSAISGGNWGMEIHSERPGSRSLICNKLLLDWGNICNGHALLMVAYRQVRNKRGHKHVHQAHVSSYQ